MEAAVNNQLLFPFLPSPKKERKSLLIEREKGSWGWLVFLWGLLPMAGSPAHNQQTTKLNSPPLLQRCFRSSIPSTLLSFAAARPRHTKEMELNGLSWLIRLGSAPQKTFRKKRKTKSCLFFCFIPFLSSAPYIHSFVFSLFSSLSGAMAGLQPITPHKEKEKTNKFHEFRCLHLLYSFHNSRIIPWKAKKGLVQLARFLFGLVAVRLAAAHNQPKDKSIELPVLRRIPRSKSNQNQFLHSQRRNWIWFVLLKRCGPLVHRQIKLSFTNSNLKVFIYSPSLILVSVLTVNTVIIISNLGCINPIWFHSI